MIFSDKHVVEIPPIISEPRFAPYLRECNGNRIEALKLYQWNLRISAAFIIPLHILEVSIRNAVVEALENVHTSNWPWNQGFRISLPNPSHGYSPRHQLEMVARQQPTMGKVVAELSLRFWEGMFTSRHDARIWDGRIHSLFPSAPPEMSVQELRYSINQEIRNI